MLFLFIDRTTTMIYTTALSDDLPILVLVPCGGGGLSAGCALARAEECTDTAIYADEPAAFDETARSLAAGKRLGVAAGAELVAGIIAAIEERALWSRFGL